MAEKNEDVLNGLQEIAVYMSITPRTVHRWENAHGLPLHKPLGPGGPVFAYKSELEKWRRGELKQSSEVE